MKSVSVLPCSKIYICIVIFYVKLGNYFFVDTPKCSTEYGPVVHKWTVKLFYVFRHPRNVCTLKCNLHMLATHFAHFVNWHLT